MTNFFCIHTKFGTGKTFDFMVECDPYNSPYDQNKEISFGILYVPKH